MVGINQWSFKVLKTRLLTSAAIGAALASVSPAFASPIPNLTSEGLVLHGGSFTYGAAAIVNPQNTSTQTSSPTAIVPGVSAPIATFNFLSFPSDTTPLTFSTDANPEPTKFTNNPPISNPDPPEDPLTVPEPSSFWLLGTALAGLGLISWRRGNKPVTA